MSEAIKELEDAGQPLYKAQKVQQLLKSIKNDDVQVHTTLSIIQDQYLNDFNGASLTLSCTISTCFANIEPMKDKHNIGAVHTNQGRGQSGCGHGRSRHSGGRSTGGNRQHRVALEKSGTPGTIANCKLDTHADTCVAGSNFQIEELTGEYCDMAPFSNKYKLMRDVPIVNASTAFTNNAGTTVILRFNLVLWYGTKLNVSLISPNQLCHYGLVVLDDPTNKDCFFGINTKDFEIPFEMKGITVFFQSRVPKIENCRTIELKTICGTRTRSI
jgi:hypothetical protein